MSYAYSWEATIAYMEAVNRLKNLHITLRAMEAQIARLENSDTLRVCATSCMDCQRKGEILCDHNTMEAI